MTDKPSPWLQFRLSTLLLLVAIFGLTVALIISQILISRLEAEAATGRPISVEEVARQFEKQTGSGPVGVKVTGIRYSSKDDAYRVEFSWIDPMTKQNWQSEVQLKADGYGKFFGMIGSDQFMQSLGYTGHFPVVVETPSACKP